MSRFLDYTFALGTSTVASLAVLAVMVLLLAHLAGRRRRRLVVSTADPWTSTQGPARRTVLGWRMQRWLLFLLQVLIALLLVFALAEPRPNPRRVGRSVAILIDTSASMGAVVEGKSRLERAREEAARVVGGLGAGDRALVAGFGRRLQLELGLCADREMIQAAIERVQAVEDSDDLTAAVGAAAELLAGKTAQILVLGDHRPDPSLLRDLSARLRTAIDYRPVGASADNVGIAAFSLNGSGEDRTRLEAVLTARAAAKEPGPVTVELLAVPSGRSIARRSMSLPAAGTASWRVSWTPGADTALRAVIRDPAPGPRNSLRSDDEASVAVPAGRRRRVLLVSEGNLYLQGALRSFGGDLVLERRSAATLGSDLSGYDVVIFDAVTPAAAPERGRFLFIDPAGPGSPFPATGQVRDPVLTDARREHPLLRNVSLADLNIREARRLTSRPGDLVIASALGVPLILAREEPGLRAVALAFDIRRSDLPLRPSLPLILANALDWLAGAADQPGQAVAVALLDAAEADTRQAGVAAPRSAVMAVRGWSLADLLVVLAFVLGLIEWWAHRRR